jgi:hypothetical protein
MRNVVSASEEVASCTRRVEFARNKVVSKKVTTSRTTENLEVGTAAHDRHQDTLFVSMTEKDLADAQVDLATALLTTVMSQFPSKSTSTEDDTALKMFDVAQVHLAYARVISAEAEMNLVQVEQIVAKAKVPPDAAHIERCTRARTLACSALDFAYEHYAEVALGTF